MQNQIVPHFILPATNGQLLDSSVLKGKNWVLFFYPKDSTPGCTLEVQSFRDLLPEFAAHNTVVMGVSRDSLKSHENFKAKQSLNFELLSDSDETVCQLFGVIKHKKMYGKDVRGIERSTFVVDANGVLRREWRGVKVEGHARIVLDTIKTL